MLVYGYDSSDIDIRCTAEDSCYGLTVYGPDSDKIVINATAWCMYT